MYSVFEELCNSRGVTPYKVGKETKIASSTFSDWKNGKSKPKGDKLQAIADYFGVSVDYIMTGSEPTVEETLGAEYAHLVAKIRNDKDLSKALLKYFDLPKKEKEHVIELINILGNRSVK